MSNRADKLVINTNRQTQTHTYTHTFEERVNRETVGNVKGSTKMKPYAGFYVFTLVVLHLIWWTNRV